MRTVGVGFSRAVPFLRDRGRARFRRARPGTKMGVLVLTAAVAMVVCAPPTVSLQAPSAGASPVVTPGRPFGQGRRAPHFGGGRLLGEPRRAGRPHCRG